MPQPTWVSFGTRLKAEYRKGLVGHWKMNVNGGVLLPDLSGNNNHGTLSGFANPPTQTSGWGNGSLVFDGVNDYVNTKDDFINDSKIRRNGLTLSAWIKSANGANAGIVGLSPNNTNNFYSSGGLYFYSGKARMTAYDTGSAAYVYAISNITIKAGEWYHLVGVYDPNDTKLRIYINGSLDGTSISIITYGFEFLLDENFIGRNCHNAIPLYLSGLIDDVRIYNIALTAGQVKASYLAGLSEWDLGNAWAVGDNIAPIQLLEGRVA